MSDIAQSAPQKFYLTTPIYYVNARPHIGHAYSTIVGDVIARRHRLLGDDTYFLTGTDEHGQKIERSAAAAGVPPQEFADGVSKTFSDLWKRMGITHDGFIRTTEERHKKGVQKLFAALKERGAIYLDTYTGQYCVSDEAFVDVAQGERCPDCGNMTETITESNYYFKLSEYGERLAGLIESGELLIQPEARRNEVLSFVKSGLKDQSISRTSFKWGVPVPGDEEHVIYVWFDALVNYMTGVGYGSDEPAEIAKFEKYWPADLHLVGKEIIRFHCVYWPAFLMAAGLPIPKSIVANGWLLFEESKMSKSKGNVVRTETILDAFGGLKPDLPKKEQDLFGADVLRYFLLREIPFGQDGSFSFDSLVTRYNADLANGYGNLVSRTLKLIEQSLQSVIPYVDLPAVPDVDRDEEAWESYAFGRSNPEAMWSGNQTPFETLYQLVRNTVSLSKFQSELYSGFALNALLAEIQKIIALADGYISSRAPWKLAKQDSVEARRELEEVLYCSAQAIQIITGLLYPVMPYATSKVWEQLGLGDIEEAARNGELKDLQWGGLKPGTKLGVLAPIFPRADKGLIQVMSEVEANKVVPKSAFTDEVVPAAPVVDATHPAAGPRTFGEEGAGAHVGGSAAESTERVGTPSHTEAVASGVFAASALASAVPDTPQIAIDDFVKVDLRVAQIVVAERIPKADKLLRLEVDLGYEKRQILSGIAEWYTPEDLIGRKIVIIANLAPRKMRGLESRGMLLAASEGENGKPVLATFGEEIAVGTRLR
ncbi:methionyl-tRNA synthetase [Granulicella pectinivorans]|uniref:Methionine--tRNA ligase n=1 Tax=Granulicella pectinivorans TaxID=474950 RepID=A0A1I6M7L9_9BACT|nr:methionine--tRNA ligase [Granulicella pectinivorans]SFS11696.1 methionyl-tRNA synthetase [Granulicella pectinivorans]